MKKQDEKLRGVDTLNGEWTVIVGLFSGAISGATVQLFRFSLDKRRKRVADLIALIERAADEATVYWSNKGSEQDHSAAECMIQGKQHRISEWIAFLYSSRRRFSNIEQALTNFIGQLTGGEFRNGERPADSERAEAVQVVASLLIMILEKNGKS